MNARLAVELAGQIDGGAAGTAGRQGLGGAHGERRGLRRGRDWQHKKQGEQQRPHGPLRRPG